MFLRKYNSLTKRKNHLKEAFEKANNKDVELQTEMVQVNKNRKKTMQLLAEEKKKLEQYERTPAESERVSVISFIYSHFYIVLNYFRVLMNV